jgi:hypothetical protein
LKLYTPLFSTDFCHLKSLARDSGELHAISVSYATWRPVKMVSVVVGCVGPG